MKCGPMFGFLIIAVTLSACGDTDSPAGPDFERELGPGEYQVSVTGDLQRSFEATGAAYLDPEYPVGFEQGTLVLWDDTDLLNGAQFEICPTVQERAYEFDAIPEEGRCPSDRSRAKGGFIIQLGGVPEKGVVDCYPNDAGAKDFEGVLTITSTDTDIRGEAQGDGTCSIHPNGAGIETMQRINVSIRLRFRAVRRAP